MSVKSLPTNKAKGATNFQELLQLYYGAPGVGKTTFASNLPKPNLFLATEDGQRALEAYVTKINSWKDFLDVIELLESGEGEKFYSVTIDTVDNLFWFCENHICKVNRIDHMSDAEWGKGWSFLKKEFKMATQRLQDLGIGVIFISHAKEVEVKRRSLKIDRWVPTFGKQCREIILPLVDEMFYFAVEERTEDKKFINERLVFCHPGESWEAKDRMQKFPEIMPMDPLEFVKVYEGEYGTTTTAPRRIIKKKKKPIKKIKKKIVKK